MNHVINDYPQAIRQKFQQLSDQAPLIISSPGRINLIGEHTDYNLGFVLPAAIDKAIYLGIQRRADAGIHLYSLDYNDSHIAPAGKINPSGKLWPDYILGVVDEINRAAGGILKDQGFDIVFGGDIPPGAGLSSSAALECAAAYAVNELFSLKLEKLQMVKIAQAAENNFVGMKCGIMDQFASMFGKADHLVRLDCRNLDFQYINFNFPGITVLLFDTQVKHSLASSAYNERREQCEEGVRLVRQFHPEVESLRDVTEEMLKTHVKPVDNLIYNRCTFIVTEIQRLLDGSRDLDAGHLEKFGERMFETHDGLSKLYEVSCPELDILVDLVKNNADVLGARMMGGGFGGCTINLVKTEAVEELTDKVAHEYKKATGKDMLVYKVRIGDGTRLL